MNLTILESLSKWNCNTPIAMDRFLGDEGLYIACLQMFSEDENFEALQTAIMDHNYEMAFDFAHALKGVASNLELTPLYQALYELVESLRRNELTHLPEQFELVSQKWDEFQLLLNRASD